MCHMHNQTLPLSQMEVMSRDKESSHLPPSQKHKVQIEMIF